MTLTRKEPTLDDYLKDGYTQEQAEEALRLYQETDRTTKEILSLDPEYFLRDAPPEEALEDWRKRLVSLKGVLAKAQRSQSKSDDDECTIENYVKWGYTQEQAEEAFRLDEEMEATWNEIFSLDPPRHSVPPEEELTVQRLHVAEAKARLADMKRLSKRSQSKYPTVSLTEEEAIELYMQKKGLTRAQAEEAIHTNRAIEQIFNRLGKLENRSKSSRTAIANLSRDAAHTQMQVASLIENSLIENSLDD